jgi:conjugal transfer/type IV secretion protein DotA/TraY
MKKLLVLWLIVLMSVQTFPAWSQSATETVLGCGMSSDGQTVEAQSTEICANDISFQGLYLLFSSVFSDPAFYPIISMFVDDATLKSPFTEYADETIGVSGPIHLLLSSVAVLGWALLTPVLAVKIYPLVVSFKRTGRIEFKESNGDPLKFVTFFGFLMFLMIPAGFSSGPNGDRPPLMMGQVIAILGSLPANMGGNYIYSTYLNATQMASQEVPLKEKFLLPTGQQIAGALVEGQLCELNTRQALMTVNAKAASNFFLNTSIGELFDYDQESVAARYDQCLSYVGDVTSGPFDETISKLSLNKYTRQDESQCSRLGFGYNSEAFGQGHSCMSMSFDFGQKKFADLEETVNADSTDIDSVSDAYDYVTFNLGAVNTLRDQFNANTYYNRYKSAVSARVRSLVENQSMTAADRYKEISAVILGAGTNVISSGLASSSELSSGESEMLQARHQAAAAFLMGGTIDMSVSENLRENSLASIWSNSRRYPALAEDKLLAYGVDSMMMEAKEIAALIRSYYCAVNWKSNASARDFILAYNRAEDQGDLEQVFGGLEVKLQCVKFLGIDKKGNDDHNRYATYATEDSLAFADFNLPGIGRKADGDPAVVSAEQHFTHTVAPKLQREIQARQFILAGYSAAVKKAVADNLKKAVSAKDEDADRDLNLRPIGWGGFGGALLYTGQTQNSMMHMARSLDNAWSVSSNASNDRFIVMEAFGSVNPDQEERLMKLFGAYDTEQFFNIGSTAAGSYSVASGLSAEDDEESGMEFFMDSIEWMLLGPMDHIKAASGMPMDKPLSMGLQMCFDGGYDSCLSGAKHPVVALSDFGNDMISNMITLIAVTKVASMTFKAFNSVEDGSVSDSEEGAKKKKKSIKDKLKSGMKSLISGVKNVLGGPAFAILSIIMKALEAAVTVLEFMMPLFHMLLLVGIVFAYVLPLLAYVYGFMIMCLFWVGVFVWAVVLPLYVVTKLMTIERDYHNGFRTFYQDVMGTYLTPMLFSVGAVLSWSIIVVMLFGINITFSLIYHGLGASNEGTSVGLISSLIFNLFMYVAYFLAIFVLFRFGLGIMKSFPDLVKERLNLKKSNDSSYIDSLGFEQYVQASVMKNLAEMPGKALDAIRGHMDKGGYKSMDHLRDEVRRAEDIANRLGLTPENASMKGQQNARRDFESSKQNAQNAQNAPMAPGSQPTGPAPGPDDMYSSSATSGQQGAATPTDTTVRNTPANVMDPENFDPNRPPVRDESGKVVVPFTRGDATQELPDEPGKP